MPEPINYRAATADTGTSRLVYHVIDYLSGFASCGTPVLLGLSMPAADVPQNLRCRKSLCSRRFFGADEDARGVRVDALSPECTNGCAAPMACSGPDKCALARGVFDAARMDELIDQLCTDAMAFGSDRSTDNDRKDLDESRAALRHFIVATAGVETAAWRRIVGEPAPVVPPANPDLQPGGKFDRTAGVPAVDLADELQRVAAVTGQPVGKLARELDELDAHLKGKDGVDSADESKGST